MISPSNVSIDVGKTLNDKEYIGMCRREVFDDYLRKRAEANGTKLVNGQMLRMDEPTSPDGTYAVHFSNYDESEDGRTGKPDTIEVDIIIGADGANSRVAKAIDSGEYDYAIAFQERIQIDEDKMKKYEDLAEMYVGDDVSPDFYGWVFPKYGHVAVGTGTVVDKSGIKKYQDATRVRCEPKIAGGKLLKVEAHPIPEHPRPRRVNGRAVLVGDAAGYVTKCSGEGIYFAAKSGRMCAEAIVEASENGVRAVDEGDLQKYIDRWDAKYGPTYFVLDALQKLFYTSDAARESFVDLCG